MYRSLSNLRDSVNRLIAEQGADAPVAAFIFTKNDVFYYEMDDYSLNEEHHLNDDDTDEVLEDVGGCEYIYQQIGEIIDDEVRRIRIRNKVT